METRNRQNQKKNQVSLKIWNKNLNITNKEKKINWNSTYHNNRFCVLFFCQIRKYDIENFWVIFCKMNIDTFLDEILQFVKIFLILEWQYYSFDTCSLCLKKSLINIKYLMLIYKAFFLVQILEFVWTWN
jgi:hypothetical protein